MAAYIKQSRTSRNNEITYLVWLRNALICLQETLGVSDEEFYKYCEKEVGIKRIDLLKL